MPTSVLWAVDLFGRVYTLSTAGQYWELCKDVQLEFKRVSAATQCCWGIAGDNQVYLYVCSSDVPIRHREEAYENQRWNPMGGFCEKLLPSDRWPWSDVSGLQHRPLDGVALPSPHWEWESDWYVDENFGGEPTEKGGWTYAMDFPATYTRDKKWNSCVRRRKWIRYRRYKSRDSWAKIPSKDDPKELPDPFNDLSERTRQRWPVRLAAATEQDMNDWLALLSLSCCESRKVHGRPSPQAIWSVTCKGDIFVSEPSPDLEARERLLPCDQMFWRQMGGHLRIIEANSRGVVWGIGYDHTAWVYTGGYGGGCFQGLASSTSNIYTQSDVKSVYIYENQRWNPVTGYTSRGLPTDRFMWSDVTGLQECTKAGTKPPSLQWTWVSDWYVDFSVPGGTDQEGWQYASDFPTSRKNNSGVQVSRHQSGHSSAGFPNGVLLQKLSKGLDAHRPCTQETEAGGS